jgi:hypothetical protein
MLIELANKTIIAFSLATSKLFYGKLRAKSLSGRKEPANADYPTNELWNSQDKQHRREQWSIPHIALIQF